MAKQELENVRVAILVMSGVEEAEITQPLEALRAAGAHVDIISNDRTKLQAFNHHTPTIEIAVDKTFDEVAAEEYDALFLPGGALNADALRVVPAAQTFAIAFDSADKPIAAICHAPWLLVSADLLDGRTLTSFNSIHDDIENAGGTWLDEAVVSDGNLLTSREPGDLPIFAQRMVDLFATAGRQTPAAIG